MYNQLSTLNTLPLCIWGPVVLETLLESQIPARVLGDVSYIAVICWPVLQLCDCLLYLIFFKLHLYSHLSVRQPLGGCQGWKGCNSYFMPLRSTWLAAMSMTLMMKAMAKAHIRLLRTHVCLTCCVGLEPVREKKKWWEGKKKRLPDGPLNQMLVNAWKIYDNNFWMKELIATTITWTKS